MLSSARSGQPLDVGSSPMIRFVGIVISIVLGCAAAFIVCCFLSQQMKSVAVKAEANSYIRSDSINFSAREDHFTHTSQIRTKVESSSGSGRGGTTVDSSGFSGKSGKF